MKKLRLRQLLVLAMVMLVVLKRAVYNPLSGNILKEEHQPSPRTNLLGTPNIDASDPSPSLLPPKSCGLLYFYHIPKSGGMSMKHWLEELAENHPSRLIHFNFLYQNSPRYVRENVYWRRGQAKIEHLLKSGALSKRKQWLTVRHHHGVPGLRYFMPHLQRYRTWMDKQNCTTLLATVQREPLSRIISALFYNKIPPDKVHEFCDNRYPTTLKYILFNKCHAQQHVQPDGPICLQNPEYLYNATPSMIQEAYRYLQQFDLVGRTSQLGDFVRAIQQRAGWDQFLLPDSSREAKEEEEEAGGDNRGHNKVVPHANKSPQKYQYELTPEIIQTLQSTVEEDWILWNMTKFKLY